MIDVKLANDDLMFFILFIYSMITRSTSIKRNDHGHHVEETVNTNKDEEQSYER